MVEGGWDTHRLDLIARAEAVILGARVHRVALSLGMKKEVVASREIGNFERGSAGNGWSALLDARDGVAESFEGSRDVGLRRMRRTEVRSSPDTRYAGNS